MKKITKGFYKAINNDTQIVFATGKTGIGPNTKQPSFEGYCYYTDTNLSEFSKHWLQNAFDLDNPIQLVSF